MAITLANLTKDPLINAYVEQADRNLQAMGFTEHGKRHLGLVSNISKNILERLAYPERTQEIGAMAGYLHDIGNCIGRKHHGANGAVLLEPILRDKGLSPQEIALILSAIGNHEEEEGYPVNEVAAALILADKTDVHRTRVRNRDISTFDIHDRVNYAALKSFLTVQADSRLITLKMTIDQEISSIMDYFEIFLQRMIMCRRAAEFLGCKFKLEINDARLL